MTAASATAVASVVIVEDLPFRAIGRARAARGRAPENLATAKVFYGFGFCFHSWLVSVFRVALSLRDLPAQNICHAGPAGRHRVHARLAVFYAGVDPRIFKEERRVGYPTPMAHSD